MAGGWSKDGGVQEQIDASVDDEVRRARSRLPEGKGATHCAECGEEIPLARREALPGVVLCVACQEAEDGAQSADAGFNRRGNKGSQMR